MPTLRCDDGDDNDDGGDGDGEVSEWPLRLILEAAEADFLQT